MAVSGPGSGTYADRVTYLGWGTYSDCVAYLGCVIYSGRVIYSGCVTFPRSRETGSVFRSRVRRWIYGITVMRLYYGD